MQKQPMPDVAAIDPTAAAPRVRVAARALAKAGLVHAYGHCSARLGVHQFLVSPPKPLGLVAPEDAPVIVATAGKLPAGALPEVIAHQHIYRLRAEVGGGCKISISPCHGALCTWTNASSIAWIRRLLCSVPAAALGPASRTRRRKRRRPG